MIKGPGRKRPRSGRWGGGHSHTSSQLTTIRAQIAALVQASGTGVTGLYGIGPVIAGRILAEVGDVRRFAT